MRMIFPVLLMVLSACAYAPPTRDAMNAATDTALHIELHRAGITPWYFPATRAACMRTAAEIRGVLVARHPEWPESVKSAVAAGRIQVGTQREHLLASWGWPDRINRTATRAGARDQWVYDEASISRMRFVYVERGMVVVIQD